MATPAVACPRCNKSFAVSFLLEKHLKQRRQCNESGKEYACDYCLKTFGTTSLRSRHVRKSCGDKKLADAGVDVKTSAVARAQTLTAAKETLITHQIVPFTFGREIVLTTGMVDEALASSPRLAAFNTMPTLNQIKAMNYPVVIEAMIAMVKCAHADPRQCNMYISPARQDQVKIFGDDGEWSTLDIKAASKRLLECVNRQLSQLILTAWGTKSEPSKACIAAGAILLLYAQHDLDGEHLAGLVAHLGDLKKPEGRCVVATALLIQKATVPADWKVKTMPQRLPPYLPLVCRAGGDIGTAVRDRLEREFKDASAVTLERCRELAEGVADDTGNPFDFELLSDVSNRAWKLSVDEFYLDDRIREIAGAVAKLLVTGNAVQKELMAAKPSPAAAMPVVRVSAKLFVPAAKK